MPVFRFPGVHGTKSCHADIIQKIGFRHLTTKGTYARMFGRGVYMFLDDEHGQGRGHAMAWALHVTSQSEKACYLALTATCEEQDVIEWTNSFEDQFTTWFYSNYEQIKEEGTSKNPVLSFRF